MAEIQGWFTINGKHIPIMKGETKDQAVKKYLEGKNSKTTSTRIAVDRNKKISNYVEEAKNTRESIKELKSDKYADGTYDVSTKKSVEFSKGYQATFQQTGDKYTDAEYGKLIDTYKKKGDGKAYAGKFGGEPEVSFHFKSKKEAIEICKKYNQVSYWDWKTMSEIKNPYYKKGKGNDYE